MVQLTREQILALAAPLREFGVTNTPLTTRWEQVEANRKDMDNPICVVAALNNADTKGVWLELVRQFPRDLMEGIALTAQVVNVERKFLVLPKGQEELEQTLSPLAEEYGVILLSGMVNARVFRGSAIHHVATMIALGQSAAGTYTPGTYLAVQVGDQVGALTKVSYGTSVADVVGEQGKDVDAFSLGYHVYPASQMSMLVEEDTPVGDGVLTLYPTGSCLIHEAEKVLMDFRRQSCGKCTFCREGLIQLHTMTREITQGMGKQEFVDMMQEIGEAMTFSTPCSVGQVGSQFTLDTLSHFASDYNDHIKRKTCKNNVCTAFQTIYIDPSLCEGCEDCVDVCPVDCIEGKAGYIHMIDEFDCTRCGKCMEVCDSDAIVRTSGRVPKLPTRLTKCGKFKGR